ncbi:hypothetical protein SDRG_10882 [Saprolegnia diclina VS20]|uniref:Uncharacterized protein n=1 Tax=Saprolegnia diclina (strain VS20) TaxID=1156394 RepID=T0RG71_SAPDV|nr:hypothetical protein SDRG_10882 [Saprolegnia diclina VS20]EQC31278.1 hypothetical protein SDRG_10882 [Saprolegnia diclina VS20]|eukprot:XP_008615119.1 hypothetical protein SDRG_10882 [Saprolegnia diclina VS20]
MQGESLHWRLVVYWVLFLLLVLAPLDALLQALFEARQWYAIDTSAVAPKDVTSPLRIQRVALAQRWPLALRKRSASRALFLEYVPLVLTTWALGVVPVYAPLDAAVEAALVVATCVLGGFFLQQAHTRQVLQYQQEQWCLWEESMLAQLPPSD